MNKLFFTIVFLVFGLTSFSYSQKYNRSTTVFGKIDYLEQGDSILIKVFENSELFDGDLASSIQIGTTNGEFTARIKKISTLKRMIFSILSKNNSNKFIFNSLINPGDSIEVSSFNNKLHFKGRGASVFNFLYEQHDRYINVSDISFPYYAKGGERKYINFVNSVDSAAKWNLQLLDTYRDSMNYVTFQSIKAEIICFYEAFKIAPIRRWCNPTAIKVAANELQNYKSPLKNTLIDIIKNPSINLQSIFIPQALLEEFWFDSCFAVGRKIEIKSYRKYVNELLHRRNIDAFLVYALKDKIKRQTVTAGDVVYVRNNLKDTLQKGNMNYLLKSSIPGAKAFNFVLPDTSGAYVRLSDFKGQIVLLDFWCRDRALNETFKGKPFSVIGISIDKKRNVWLESIKNGMRSSSENVNLFTNGKGSESSVIKKLGIEGYPTLILIDKNGFILPFSEDPRIDSARDLIKMIKSKI